jgi:hypothetical protein
MRSLFAQLQRLRFVSLERLVAVLHNLWRWWLDVALSVCGDSSKP